MLFAHMLMQPYVDEWNNRMETVTLLSLVFISILLQLNGQNSGSSGGSGGSGSGSGGGIGASSYSFPTSLQVLLTLLFILPCIAMIAHFIYGKVQTRLDMWKYQRSSRTLNDLDNEDPIQQYQRSKFNKVSMNRQDSGVNITSNDGTATNDTPVDIYDVEHIRLQMKPNSSSSPRATSPPTTLTTANSAIDVLNRSNARQSILHLNSRLNHNPNIIQSTSNNNQTSSSSTNTPVKSDNAHPYATTDDEKAIELTDMSSASHTL
jgi:preprotein translocase subunit SecG